MTKFVWISTEIDSGPLLTQKLAPDVASATASLSICVASPMIYPQIFDEPHSSRGHSPPCENLRIVRELDCEVLHALSIPSIISGEAQRAAVQHMDLG